MPGISSGAFFECGSNLRDHSKTYKHPGLNHETTKNLSRRSTQPIAFIWLLISSEILRSELTHFTSFKKCPAAIQDSEYGAHRHSASVVLYTKNRLTQVTTIVQVPYSTLCQMPLIKPLLFHGSFV